MDRTAEIYTITHPGTQRIFYVGSSCDFALRKYTHLLGSNKSKVASYIREEIQSAGFEPIFTIIDSCYWIHQFDVEFNWIEYYFNLGEPLLNRKISKVKEQNRAKCIDIKLNISKELLFEASKVGKLNKGMVSYIQSLIEKDLKSA